MSAPRNAYAVAAFNPFWRYAVALDDRPDLPAVPFFSKAAALAFFDASCADLDWARTVLLKRRFRSVEVVQSGGAAS
jgi:hypothetical protein